MVAQYPHILITTILNAEAVRDENGNWMQPDLEPTVYNLPCRAEPNSNSVIILPDGTQYRFSFRVYMPDGTPDIPTGVAVTITGVAKGTVKQFYRGQLNCRLWL